MEFIHLMADLRHLLKKSQEAGILAVASGSQLQFSDFFRLYKRYCSTFHLFCHNKGTVARHLKILIAECEEMHGLKAVSTAGIIYIRGLKALSLEAEFPSSAPESVAVEKTTRPRLLTGSTYKITTGCGSMYVTCNNDSDGRLVEVFAKLGKPGGCAAAVNEGFGRLISNSLQSGGNPSVTVNSLRGISCQHPASGHDGASSCLDAIARVMGEHLLRLCAAVDVESHIGNGGRIDDDMPGDIVP